MSRRIAVLVPSAALLVAGAAVPALLGHAAAAPACPSWTDTRGDATTGEAPDPAGKLYDANMDITGVTLTPSATSLTAVMKLATLTAAPSDFGDEFDVDFTVAGKHLQLFSVRDGNDLETRAGIYSWTAKKEYADKAKAVYDTKTSTLTLTATMADITTAAGVAVAGQSAGTLSASTFDYFTGPGESLQYDEATTTATAVLGASCGGSGTPAPSPTPTTSPTPVPPSSGGDPMKDFPKANCNTVADIAGDGKIAGNGVNDPDLDISSLTLRNTATHFLGYVKVDRLATGPATTDGHRYAIDFTFNKHVFTLSATSSTHGSHAARDAAAQSGLVGHVVQLGVDVPSTTAVPPPTNRGLVTSGLKVDFDVPNSRVVFSLPIADIVKYGGAPFAGALSAVDAKSQVESNVLSFAADTAGGATTTWTVGDNKCFTLPTAIKLAVLKKGTARTVTATLTAAGKGLAKQPLAVYVNGKKVATITTDATGKASYTKANPSQTVKVTFAGASGYEPSTATVKV